MIRFSVSVREWTAECEHCPFNAKTSESGELDKFNQLHRLAREHVWATGHTVSVTEKNVTTYRKESNGN